MSVGLYVLVAVVFLIIGVFIGVKVTKRSSLDGYLDVSAQDTSQIHQLEILTEPDMLRTQDRVILKVRKIPASE